MNSFIITLVFLSLLILPILVIPSFNNQYALSNYGNYIEIMYFSMLFVGNIFLLSRWNYSTLNKEKIIFINSYAIITLVIFCTIGIIFAYISPHYGYKYSIEQILAVAILIPIMITVGEMSALVKKKRWSAKFNIS